MSLLDSALQYAGNGLRVIPLQVNEKKPAVVDWVQKATTDETTIKKWWGQNPNYNIGIVTGNGIHVIDIDVKNEKNGFNSLHEWQEMNSKKLPTTATVETPTGGAHYYYFVDNDYKNSANILPGVDTRGIGGFVVAPPSMINEKVYIWKNNDPFVNANEDVYDLLNKRNLPQCKNEVQPTKEIENGARNDTLFRLACSLQSKGLSDDAILKAVWAENKNKCSTPLTQDEVKSIVSSALKHTKNTAPYVDNKNAPIPKLEVLSASHLEGMELAPITWVVKNLLPVGLALLSAPPKYYKSFMALGLCVAVSTGGEFLGYETVKADTLYFDLESTKRRPKDRLEKIMGAFFPDNLYLITAEQEVRPLGVGFEEQLLEVLDNNTHIKLVIIDVFQKIRPPQKGNKGVYDRDYDDLKSLKKIADTKSVCILLIHHTRKGKDDDVFNQVSGSTGLTGAMDSAWVLAKDRYSTEGVLSTTGRDMDSVQLKVEFNKETFQWEYLGSLEDFEKSREQFLYDNNPVILTIKEILARMSNPWEGSASDIKELSRFYKTDIDDDIRTIGKAIAKYKDKLLEDLISYEVKKSGSKRYYKFNDTDVPNITDVPNVTDVDDLVDKYGI